MVSKRRSFLPFHFSWQVFFLKNYHFACCINNVVLLNACVVFLIMWHKMNVSPMIYRLLTRAECVGAAKREPIFLNNQSERDTGLADMHMSHFWSRFTDLDLFSKIRKWINYSSRYLVWSSPYFLTFYTITKEFFACAA